MAQLKLNEPSKNARSFFDEAEKTFINLYMRWQDEKEHEDIKDYKIPIQTIADRNNCVIEKMTKKPFGCHFVTDERTYALTVGVKGYEFKRIK